jgi:hypothetical protein
MKTNLAVFLGCAGMVLLPCLAKAQNNNFQIIESAISGGGTTLSTGGSFTLSGTIGQPLVSTSRGEIFTLAAGFWGITVALQQPDLPPLSVTDALNGIVLSWPVTSTTALLEQTERLQPSSLWTTVSQTPQIVGGQNVVTIPLTGASRFFRLKTQ